MKSVKELLKEYRDLQEEEIKIKDAKIKVLEELDKAVELEEH